MKKRTKCLIVLFFLLFSLYPFNSSSLVADNPSLSADDINKFDAVLIDKIGVYEKHGYALEYVEEPVVYESEVLCEGHLPLVLDVECVKEFSLSGNLKNNFLKNNEFGKKNIDSINYEYRVLVNESYTVDVPVHKNVTVYYNVTVCDNKSIPPKCHEETHSYVKGVTDYYERVTRYHYVWRDIRYIEKIDFKYNNKIIVDIVGRFKAGLDSKSVDVVPVVNVGDFSKSFPEYAWWNSDWNRRIDLYINSSQVAEDLTNYPVLVFIDSNSTLADYCQSDLDDIAFVSSDNSTQFNHEFEQYSNDGNAVTAYIWVNVTSVSSSVNTHFNLYFNNSECASQEDINNVWDSDFLFVMHMSESSVPPINDSTANNHDGDEYGDIGTGASGIVADCLTFVADCSELGDLNEITDNMDITAEAWIKDSLSSDKFFCKHLCFIMGDEGSNVPRVELRNADDTSWTSLVATGKSFSSSAFNYMTFRVDEDANDFWLDWNGINQAVNTDCTNNDGGTNPVALGDRSDGAGYGMSGYLDEIRFSTVTRSIGYILTNYNMMKNQSSFIIWGDVNLHAEGNNLPVISNPSPSNESTFNSFTLADGVLLSIDVSDSDSDTMSITWSSNSSGSWIDFAYNNSVLDGTYTQYNPNFTKCDTLYYWKVSVSDGSDSSSDIFNLRTIEGASVPTGITIEMFNDEQLNLSWSKGVNCTHTRIQRKTGSYPSSISDGDNVYNNTGTTYDDTGLSGSTEYFYSFWGYNSTINDFSSSYVSSMQETLPQEPQSFSATTTNDTSIALSWSKGTGAENTVIRYYSGGYPSSPTNGTEAYNNTGTSVNVNNLNTGVTYYFKAWSYDTSGNFSLLNVTDSATTSWVPSSPSNLNVTSVSVSSIQLNWTRGNGSRSVVVRKTGGYPSSHTDGTEVYNNTNRFFNDTGLSTSVQYYYNVYSFNNSLWSGPVQGNNYTLPQGVQNSTATQEGGTGFLNITWDNGTGADTVVIVRKNGAYPSNRADGTEVVNSSSWWYNDTGYSDGDYYSLWSYNNSSKLYSSLHQLLWGGLTINVYNESSALAITNWDVFITNQAGDNTSEHTGQSNGASYDINTIPHGDKTAIIINATGYDSRTYYIDLDPNNQYTLNAYLSDIASDELYLIGVVTPYDNAIKDAKIIFKRAIGGSYLNVSTMYTDAAGQVDLYLIPGVLYKVVISKEGFKTEYSDYRPSNSIFTHEFEMEFVDESYLNMSSFGENITFNGYISGNNLIVNFSDNSNLTLNTFIVVYEINGSTGNITHFFNDTNTSYDIQLTIPVNISNCYNVVLYLNHTVFGFTKKSFNICVTTKLTSDNDFDNYWDAILKSNPFGWANVFGLFIIMGMLFSFGQRNAGISLIVAGFITVGLNVVVGLSLIGIVIPATIIILGFITQWNVQRRETH